MPPSNLQAALEALLFSSDQPLSLSLLAESLDAPHDEVAGVLARLGEEYAARNAGVELREIAGGHLLVTTPEQAEWVGRLLRGRKKMRLSRAGLETMAIIAYKQPVTKSEVEAIRGVDSSGVMATLLERNLVTIRGRSKVVGRPLLYGTTQEFLEYFGLRDLSELPRPEELRALVAAREPEQLDMIELQVAADVAEALPEGSAEVSGHEEAVEDSIEDGEDEFDDEFEDDEDSDDDTDDELEDDSDEDSDDDSSDVESEPAEQEKV